MIDKPKFTCEKCGDNHPTSEHSADFSERELVEKSELETELESMFSKDRVKTEEEFDALIAEVFNEICGEQGKDEFFDFVVPAIKSIYGDNYRKAGRRILEIIDKGAAQPRKNIANYFKNAIAESEKEFAKLDKAEILKNLESTINQLILEQKRNFGENKGIIAVIVFGSYTKRNFYASSDLDAMYISATEEKGVYDSLEQEYTDYSEALDNELNRRANIETDRTMYDTVAITEADEIYENIHSDRELIRGQYLIITPYPEVKVKLEHIINKQTENESE